MAAPILWAPGTFVLSAGIPWYFGFFCRGGDEVSIYFLWARGFL